MKLFRIFTQTDEQEDSLERYQDFGPLEIEDHTKFLLATKLFFNKNWKKDVKYKESMDTFEIIELVGGGTFSEVVLAKHLETEKCFAIKILKKENVVKKNQVMNVISEKSVLQGLNSPFTIYLVSFFMNSSSLFFVLPFIPGGELFEYFAKFKKFEEPQVLFYSAQIVLGLEYLHYLDLIYRDLKPENVLVDHLGYLKLADFGFCKRIRGRTYTLCGTPEYLAPEIVSGKGYGVAVDWWALGVFIFELTAGRSPFYNSSRVKIYGNICNCEYMMDTRFTEDLQDIIRRFLQVDISKRIGTLKNGVNDIKNHKWFRPVNWMAILNRKVPADFVPNLEEKCGTKIENSLKDKEKIKLVKMETEDKFSNLFDDF